MNQAIPFLRTDRYRHDVDAFLAGERDKRGPLFAELVPEINPCWHLIETFAGAENLAAAHLAGRRFGIFLPMFKRTKKDRFGVRRTRIINLLPGYLFLFVWNLAKHQRRILSCPGVRSIHYVAGEPYIVPDSLIDTLRIKETQYDEDLDAIITGNSKKKKRRWRKSREGHAPIQSAEITIGPYSVLDRIEELDAEGRISVFRQVIGIGAGLQAVASPA